MEHFQSMQKSDPQRNDDKKYAMSVHVGSSIPIMLSYQAHDENH